MEQDTPLNNKTEDLFDAENFDAQNYVQQLSNKMFMTAELLVERQKLQSLSEEVNNQLKENVYQNYLLFINAAKEINYLEKQMYQLSQLFSDQKNMLINIKDLCKTKTENIPEYIITREDIASENTNLETQYKEKLKQLPERIESCKHILDYKSRQLLYEESLIELDINSYQALHRVQLFVLNDSIMIATWLPNRRGPVRHKFHSLYDIKHLAVINVKDAMDIQYAFKLMNFGETRLFQCASADDKINLLALIEKVQKSNPEVDIKSTNKNQRLCYSITDDGTNEKKMNSLSNEMNVIPDWLSEFSNEFEYLIAQRSFDEAVALLDKLKNHSNSGLKHNTYKENLELLSNVLINEISRMPEKSLQGGPFAIRHLVKLVVTLEKPQLACKLFLKRMSSMLKFYLKQSYIENSACTYIQQLNGIFFKILKETVMEFNKIFAVTSDESRKKLISYFIIWVKNEFENFVKNNFIPHTFLENFSLNNIANCIVNARMHCEKVRVLGIDFVFLFNKLIYSRLATLLQITKEKHLDIIKIKFSDQKWHPINLKTAENYNKFLQEMKEIELESVEMYLRDNYWIMLTSNVCNFSRLYLNLVDDILYIISPDIEELCTNLLVTVMLEELKMVKRKINDATQDDENELYENNLRFLRDCVLLQANHKVEEKMGKKIFYPNMIEIF